MKADPRRPLPRRPAPFRRSSGTPGTDRRRGRRLRQAAPSVAGRVRCRGRRSSEPATSQLASFSALRGTRIRSSSRCGEQTAAGSQDASRSAASRSRPRRSRRSDRPSTAAVAAIVSGGTPGTVAAGTDHLDRDRSGQRKPQQVERQEAVPEGRADCSSSWLADEEAGEDRRRRRLVRRRAAVTLKLGKKLTLVNTATGAPLRAEALSTPAPSPRPSRASQHVLPTAAQRRHYGPERNSARACRPSPTARSTPRASSSRARSRPPTCPRRATRCAAAGCSPSGSQELKAPAQSDTKGAGSCSPKKVKPKSLQVFSRQFATMIEAGLSVVTALVILEQQTDD